MQWFNGLNDVLTASSLLAIGLGCVLGLFLGSLPGLGPAFTLSVFVPLTFHVSALTALIFLVSLYTSAVYGGAITAILVNVPGHPGNVATVFDGQPMTRQGRAREAITAVGVAGAVAGLLAVVILAFVTPFVSEIVLRISPADYFMIALFGLSLVAATAGKNVLQGLVLVGLGLAFSTLGEDTITGGSRFTFGSKYLEAHGVPFEVVVVGMFAIGSGFVMLEQRFTHTIPSRKHSIHKSRSRDGLVSAARNPAPVLRSSVLGIIMGIFPGLGIALANIFAYFVEAKVNPQKKWGQGEVVGVMAPEAADNGSLISELIPTFALGIPGHATSALILGALAVHGLQPGPSFFHGNPVSSALFIAMFFTQFVICLLGISLAGTMELLARTPKVLLAPIIIVAGFVGAFATDGEYGDLVVAGIFGLIGYIILRCGFPLAPLILGMILGPLVEENFRRALTIQDATGKFMLYDWVPAILAVLTVLSLTAPLLAGAVRRVASGLPRARGTDRSEVTLVDH